MIGTIVSCPRSEAEIEKAMRDHLRLHLGLSGIPDAEVELDRVSPDGGGGLFMKGSLFIGTKNPRAFSGILYPHPQSGFVEF